MGVLPCANCGEMFWTGAIGTPGEHRCKPRTNSATEPTELMAAHKARIEFMEAMGQAHFSRTDAQWHVAHFAKTVGAELETENAKLRAENTNLRFALTVLEERLKVADLQVDELRKALTRIDAMRKRLPDPDFSEQRNTASGIAEIVQEALADKRIPETPYDSREVRSRREQDL